MTKLTINSIRFGARADADGSAQREADTSVSVELGNIVTAGSNGMFQVDPSTKWVYVGTETGVNMMAPQSKGNLADCHNYDPRIRPWYAEAFSGAKNVIIVVDGSGAQSTDEFLSMKQGAKAILGTLAAGDTANVVFARGSGATPDVAGSDYGTDITYNECQTDQMLRQTSTNNDLLNRFVDNEGKDSSSEADIYAAIQVGQGLLGVQRNFAAANYPSISSKDVVIVLAGSAYMRTSSEYSTLKSGLNPQASWVLHSINQNRLNVNSANLGVHMDRKGGSGASLERRERQLN